MNAEILSEYKHDFYKGMCALARNNYGKGKAYYLACNTEEDFLYELYSDVLDDAAVSKIINTEYIKDVMIRERGNYIFVMNFSTEDRTVRINDEDVVLSGYDFRIIKK